MYLRTVEGLICRPLFISPHDLAVTSALCGEEGCPLTGRSVCGVWQPPQHLRGDGYLSDSRARGGVPAGSHFNGMANGGPTLREVRARPAFRCEHPKRIEMSDGRACSEASGT